MRRNACCKLGLIGAGFALALVTTPLLDPPPAQAASNSSETYRALNLFGDVFERVRSEYVEEVLLVRGE